jgi:hypothetical protein
VATVEQLEGRPFPAVEGETTFLIGRCTQLMKTVDVDDFTTEDYRILLGQQLGVFHLLPRAVAILLVDPLAEGDFYPGDLLAAVLRLPADCWHAYPDHAQALAARIASLRPEDYDSGRMADAAAAFIARHP